MLVRAEGKQENVPSSTRLLLGLEMFWQRRHIARTVPEREKEEEEEEGGQVKAEEKAVSRMAWR